MRRFAATALAALLLVLPAAPLPAAVPLLWEEQPLTADRAENARVAVATANGETILAGSILSASGRFAFADRRDWDGTVLWERTWPEFPGAQVNAAVEAPNGDLLFAGTAHIGSYTNDLLLFRTDAAGTVLWSRLVPGAGGAVDLALRPDGSVAAVTGYYRDGTVHAFGPDGVPLWSYAPGDGSKFRAVAALPDGSLLAAGHRGDPLGGSWFGGIYYYSCAPGTTGGCGEALVTRLSPGGSVAWSRSYPALPSTLLASLAPDGDGVTVAGQTLVSTGTRADVAVARIDLSGAFRWARFLGGASVDEPAGIAPVPGGGALLLANSASCGGVPLAWFARLSPDGAVAWHQQAVPPANGKAWVMANSLAAAPAGGYAVSATLSDGYFMMPAFTGDVSDGHVSAWGLPDSRVPGEGCNPLPPAPPPGGGPPPPLAVRIDVKAASDGKAVNPGERGLVDVALFSAPGFDAGAVELPSLRFAGAAPKANPDGKVVVNRRDVDRDGLPDLVVRFRPEPDRYGEAVPETLTGRTAAGRDFAGTDTVTWKGTGPSR